MKKLLLLLLLAVLRPQEARADRSGLFVDTLTGQTHQTLDLDLNHFKQAGAAVNFGNAAGQVPFLDGSAFLPSANLPNAGTAGTYGDATHAITLITDAKGRVTTVTSNLITPAGIGAELPLTFSGPLSRTTNTISLPAATGSVNGYLASGDWTIFNNKVPTARSISTTAPLAGGGDLSANRTFSIAQATTSVDGYLSAIDWTAFNGKENALTFSSPLSRTTNTISLPAATGSVNGYLASGDWTTFNNKVATTRSISTTAPITGGGDLSANRTLAMAAATTSVDGYLSATDWTAFNNKVAATRSISTTAPITGGGDLSANRTLAMAAATTSVDGYLSSASFTIFNNKVGTARAINTTSPITGGGDLSADRTISLPAATGSVNGYLASGDWTTFNGKENALTFSSPLSRATNTISLPAATGSVNGYLSSGDWTTFNGKENALTFTNGITRTTNTIGLGAITPSSVAASGAVSGTTFQINSPTDIFPSSVPTPALFSRWNAAGATHWGTNWDWVTYGMTSGNDSRLALRSGINNTGPYVMGDVINFFQGPAGVGGVNIGGITDPGAGYLSVSNSVVAGDHTIGVTGSYSANVVFDTTITWARRPGRTRIRRATMPVLPRRRSGPITASR
jgi:hypothetical protein